MVIRNSSDMNKSCEQLLQEIAELRDQVNRNEEHCRELIQELTCMKSNALRNHTPESMKEVHQEFGGLSALIEKQFETILDYIPTGILIAGSDGKILLGNLKAREMFGSGFHESRNIEEYEYWNLHQPDGSLYEPHQVPMARALRGIKVEGEVTLFPSPGGDWMHVSVNASPVFDQNGEVLFGIITVEDITKESQTEQSLRESEEKFRLLMEHSPEAVFMTNPDGSIMSANPAACAMFERSEQELCKLGRSGVLDIEDPRFSTALEKRRQAGFIHACELTAIRRDGEKFPVELDSVILSAEPLQSFVIIRDVTERKQAEEKLKKKRWRLAAALQIAKIGIWEYDPETDLTRFDEQARKIFGINEDRPVPGEEIFDWIHPEDREGIEKKVFAALEFQESGICEAECRIVLPDGRVSWIAVLGNAVPSNTAEEKAAAFIGTVIDTTESKQAEKELDHQREILENIVNNIPVLIVLWDPGLGRFSLNRHAEAVLGWTTEDANADDFMSRVYPDPEYRSKVIAYMQSLESGWREWIANTKNGERVPIEWANVNLTDDTMIGIGIDLRNRKLAEQALQEKNERLRLALEATRLGTWEYDPCTQKVFWDKRSREIFGTSDENLDASGFIRLVHPDDRSRVAKTVDDGLNPLKGSGVVDFRIFRPDGGMRWVSATGKAYFAEKEFGSTAVHAIGTNLDITGFKHAENALRESEERLRLATEAANMYGWEFDLITRELKPSDNAGKAMKFPVAKTIGDVWRRIHPDDYPRVRKTMDQAVEECGEYRIEYRINPSPEEEYWIFTAGVTIAGSDGKPARVVGVTQNITERKKAEEMVHRWNESLEQQVAERTELAECRAKQLQSLAVELVNAEERVRKKMAAVLHDDLQQLLAGARFQQQAALIGLPEDSPLLPMFSNVDTLLEESIEKSRRLSHELSPPVLHQSGLFAGLQWLGRQMREQFNLRIELEVEKDAALENSPLKVFLFRAVQELLFNVVKHAGVMDARVTLVSTDTDLKLAVSDKGRGFDPNMIEFSSTTTGFGILSLRERTRNMGGDLTIESAPGTGSRFIVNLPLDLVHKRDYPQVVPLAQPVKRIPEAEPGIKELIRILVVDNHRMVRQGLIAMLGEQPDLQVIGEAANGKEAVKRVRELVPDVVVMDISMSEMDGLEATRLIRTEYPDVKVIGLSMHNDEQVARKIHHAGADGFVSKSASYAELLQAVYGMVNMKKVDND